MKDNKNDKKKSANKWLALINIPLQMGIIVFAFAYFGDWLDERYESENGIYVKVLTLVGVAVAFYNINRLLKDINKAEDRNKK